MSAQAIDWAPFDKWPEGTCTCRCGRVFRSHAKCVMTPVPHLVARKPCPSCGKADDCSGFRSDPEKMTL